MATIKWKNADRETRERLLAEYDALPTGTPDKQIWLGAHGMDVKTGYVALSYIRSQLRKTQKQARKQAKLAAAETSTALVLATNGTTPRAELLAQYETLPKGSKTDWLKQHGLYKTWPTSARIALRKAAARARGYGEVVVQPLPATPAPVTLDEAIMAFEVRQDIMREFIEQLKRMKQGAR